MLLQIPACDYFGRKVIILHKMEKSILHMISIGNPYRNDELIIVDKM